MQNLDFEVQRRQMFLQPGAFNKRTRRLVCWGAARGATQATFVSHLAPKQRNVLRWTPSKAVWGKNKLIRDIDSLTHAKVLAEQVASPNRWSMIKTTDGKKIIQFSKNTTYGIKKKTPFGEHLILKQVTLQKLSVKMKANIW